MPVIVYRELEKTLDRSAADSGGPGASLSPVDAAFVLIHGEEMLVKSALKLLIDCLIPDDTRSISYEPVDAAAGELHEAVEKVCTYPLLGGRKVVALLDAPLFASRKIPAALLRKSREAVEANRLQRAASYLLEFAALTGVDLDDLTGAGRDEHLPEDLQLSGDSRWLEEIISFCRQTGRTSVVTADTAGLLEKTVARGIPAGNRLILTTEAIDRRKKLYELIKEKGLVVDCSVPKGQRQADKKAQEAVLLEMKNSLLKRHDKTMQPGAFELLYEMTGFQPRAFSGNLEKLITYAGDRRDITRSDVEAVLERTRQDPIFAFTNAVTERNAAPALFYLNSLLHDPQQPMRPEQIVVAILNQVRKLLRIKEFQATADGSAWFATCPFGTFKTDVLPAIVSHDRQLMQCVEQWRHQLKNTGDPDTGGAGGDKRYVGKAGSDLSIAPQPKNPYPVYQLFKKSELFSLDTLRQAVEYLARADRRIKRGSENKQLILEKLVWNICGGEDAIDEDRVYHRPGK